MAILPTNLWLHNTKYKQHVLLLALLKTLFRQDFVASNPIMKHTQVGMISFIAIFNHLIH